MMVFDQDGGGTRGHIYTGVDGTGVDVTFYGETAGRYVGWDETSDILKFQDNTKIAIGSSSDLLIYHDGSDNYISSVTGTLQINTNSDGRAIAIGHTTSQTTINDKLTVTGTLIGGRSSVEAVTATDPLTAAESGKIFVFTDAQATLTLPDSGAGDIIGVTFTFISNFQGTGQKVVCADTGNEDMVGTLAAADNDDFTVNRTWVALVANSFSSINITSVAQGHPGSRWTVTNIATDVWYVTGTMIQSGGSEVTPFATT
jgi:hypothetical protein